jgi:hypothetical protein
MADKLRAAVDSPKVNTAQNRVFGTPGTVHTFMKANLQYPIEAKESKSVERARQEKIESALQKSRGLPPQYDIKKATRAPRLVSRFAAAAQNQDSDSETESSDYKTESECQVAEVLAL